MWRSGVVVSLGRSWTGAQELAVGTSDGMTVRALAYPQLVGAAEVGASVLLNVSAQHRGLGTGGYALVVAYPNNLPPDPPAGPGHLVKARYTPLQTLVLGVDEQESTHHDVLRKAENLGGMPVVTADLHSALPAIVAGARAQAEILGSRPPRVCYVMTDGGALPAWFSRTAAALRELGWLDSVITVGQAFGGDHEAVSVHSGLLAARHVFNADIVVVAQGPGNLGTGTSWGFSGVGAGEALNAAATLGGQAIASVRVSAADARLRHRGISHHSLTAYGRVALAPARVVIPSFQTAGFEWLNERLLTQIDEVSGHGRHEVIRRNASATQLDALENSPVQLSTMGRGLAEDPTPFLAAFVAGEYATELQSQHA